MKMSGCCRSLFRTSDVYFIQNRDRAVEKLRTNGTLQMDSTACSFGFWDSSMMTGGRRYWGLYDDSESCNDRGGSECGS